MGSSLRVEEHKFLGSVLLSLFFLTIVALDNAEPKLIMHVVVSSILLWIVYFSCDGGEKKL
jgi:hypothetical protein